MDYSSRLKSKMTYVYDSDEEQEEEEDMLLACILVSEYLEEKEERAKFYVRERIVNLFYFIISSLLCHLKLKLLIFFILLFQVYYVI